jgi:hypothetical protein
MPENPDKPSSVHPSFDPNVQTEDIAFKPEELSLETSPGEPGRLGHDLDTVYEGQTRRADL